MNVSIRSGDERERERKGGGGGGGDSKLSN